MTWQTKQCSVVVEDKKVLFEYIKPLELFVDVLDRLYIKFSEDRAIDLSSGCPVPFIKRNFVYPAMYKNN